MRSRASRSSFSTMTTFTPLECSAVISSDHAGDLYLRGRYFWNQLSASGTRRAVEFFTRATELDPGYALAWSGLATAWASGPISGDAPPLQLWPRSREASAHAVAGGSGLAEVQTSLGMLKFWLDWDWEIPR